MSDPDEDSAPGADIPDELKARIDSLDPAELDALLAYVNERIGSREAPLEEEIEESAAGEIIDIEIQGSEALVKQRLPDQESSEGTPGIVSLYRVTRERLMDGGEELHWVHLGEVHDQE